MSTVVTSSRLLQQEFSPPSGFKRLIDNTLLHQDASDAGLAERYARGQTSHTIHVWWARRPHTAMRALVFASLCKEDSDEAVSIYQALSKKSVSFDILYRARQFLRAQYTDVPRLLDMFAGGGTIPIESCALGVETYAVDVNELATFILNCSLVYSHGIDFNHLERILRTSGTRVLQELALRSTPLFPLRNKLFENCQVFAYIWTYKMTCPNCGYKFYLSKRPWLSKKRSPHIAIIFKNDATAQSTVIETVTASKISQSVWTGRNGTVKCPKCNNMHSQINIHNCEDEIVALVASKGRGKVFLKPSLDSVPSIDSLNKIESSVLRELQIDLPNSLLPCWSGIVNPSLYGIRTHSEFLNRRQRIVLLLLVKILRDEFFRLRSEFGFKIARYVIALLAGLIDQLVDWNCRLSMWIPENEQVGRAFCGPGVPMLWDYVELDPTLNGPANLWKKLERIISGAKTIANLPGTAYVKRGCAQSLPFPNDYFDAIVTDPPYYDNLYYNVLADFFFSWKRLVLKIIDPDLFACETTSSSGEIVASTFRSGSPEKAHQEYVSQLTLALQEAQRVLKPDGIFCLVYSHSSLKGWDALLRAYQATAFQVTSVQPLRIERRQRPRAMTAEAVNTCLVFVARKVVSMKPALDEKAIENRLEEIYRTFILSLVEDGWEETDVALTLFANGVGILANSVPSQVSESCQALKAIERFVKRKFPNFRVSNRKPL